ncbi:MAG: hypothetical protein IPI35_14925 [Deltaproteobacteria bacterium]|nr:hypothetical protein [Deltaproteobacteria bacterium]
MVVGHPSKLVIPGGAEFTSTEAGLVIEHSGDIHLVGPLSRPVARVIAGGDIELSGDLEVGEVLSRGGEIRVSGRLTSRSVIAQAGDVLVSGDSRITELTAPAGAARVSGKVELGRVQALVVVIEGRVTAELLRGDEVNVLSGEHQLRAIEGAVVLRVGEARLTSDVIVAPQVEVHPKCGGRATVIECRNQLGPNGLKGGYSLAEYAEEFGIDGGEFLTRRGVRSLADLAPAPAAPVAPTKPSAPLPTHDDLSQDLISVGADVDLPSEDIGEANDDLELLDTPTSPGNEAQEPVEELTPEAIEPVALIDAALQAELESALELVSASYSGQDEPLAVSRLRALIVQRDHTTLRAQVSDIWNELIQHYQQRKNVRPPHAVIRAINNIHSALRRA